ncbi:MAG: hypothetical protein Q7V20_03525 [Aquabacterium sp.]|uniref:hypothetical protein n=1 Tax=Aquabacterium sp. TaxID=1872578 RepID=UPI00271BAA4F|nr:hypothetical protein [Aquabacterium sp.]MDO9002512.1 hypothetical protein [Aquabacterium sp.]
MHRCLLTASVALALAVPVLASAQMQVQRNFPANALRGELVFTGARKITLNGKAARLSPGSRIRGPNQMFLMSGAITGEKLIVNYTVEQYGMVHDVWVLRPEEIKKLWPKTPQEAATWSFDPIGQTWTKP